MSSGHSGTQHLFKCTPLNWPSAKFREFCCGSKLQRWNSKVVRFGKNEKTKATKFPGLRQWLMLYINVGDALHHDPAIVISHIRQSPCNWQKTIRVHYNLIVVDRYLRRMGDKTIPDEAPPSLESFLPPRVEGIALPQSRFLDFCLVHQ